MLAVCSPSKICGLERTRKSLPDMVCRCLKFKLEWKVEERLQRILARVPLCDKLRLPLFSHALALHTTILVCVRYAQPDLD